MLSVTWSERNSDQLRAIERPTKARTASVTGPGSPRASVGRSSLHELVGDRAREHPPGRGNRRIEVRAAPIHEAEPVHLAQAADRLAGPAVDVSLPVRHAEEIPDDFF